MSRVLIADDHAVVRAGYKQFLEAEQSITEVGEATSRSETLDALGRKQWDLLLMDIRMPDRSGIDILEHVRAAYPKVPCLFAEELSLSVKTVSTYRSRILEKMSFKSNADITSYALRNDLMQ